jgi:hypothetical protein
MPDRPELVQFGDLSADHFARHPVWIQCHVVDYDEPWHEETDEETFRPRTGPLPADPTEGMLLARAAFVLADGSRHEGFLTPAVPGDPMELLGIMQPQIFLPTGGLGAFWEGIVARTPAAHAAFYDALGKTAREVFPIDCFADPALVGGVTQATLRGFYAMRRGGAVEVTT